MNPKILLIGKNGQVGRELSATLPTVGELVSLGRQDLDLSDPDEIRRIIRRHGPELIVNAAAYTAVDRAESDELSAHVANAIAPAVMAEEAAKIGALFVHYSTDYVFDGKKQTPYTEDDPANPQNVYGRTKLAGECAIQQTGAAHLIFRATWVYGREGRNFLLTILRLATEREELRIVDDQTGAPTSSREIASATTQLLRTLYSGDRNLSSFATLSGIYHMTAAGETTWCGFAKAIVDYASAHPACDGWLRTATNKRPLLVRRVIATNTQSYPTPAPRPQYSVLSNARLERVFGIRLPSWQQQLHAVFTRT
jgi:dTDP-4-dehydrorhamnose reductase